MKNLLFFAGALLLATTACKDDDGGSNPTPNAIRFDGTTYAVNAALLEDYGPYNLVSEDDPTHYNYTFAITDAARFDGEVDDVNYVLIADLYSPGTQRFTGGSFSVLDIEEATEDDVIGESVMLALLFIDLNGDGDFEDTNEMQLAEAGSVSATGSGTNYSLTFDLTFADNKKFTGTHSGNFQYVDETDGERFPASDLRKLPNTKWSF